MPKRYTKSEIEYLSSLPCVKYVREDRLVLTYEFRCALYQEWLKSPSRSTLKRVLTENGIKGSCLNKSYIDTVHGNFKRGAPSRGKNKIFGKTAPVFKTSDVDNQYLISTGRFISGERGQGISFHPDFVQELYHKYPEQSVEEGLISAGIDPAMVGYHRIYTLERRFSGDDHTSGKAVYSDGFIERYDGHPYIKRCSRKQFILEDAFYNDACILLPMHIDDILDIFELDHHDIPISTKNRISFKLRYWHRNDASISEASCMTVRIRYGITKALTQKAIDGFERIGRAVPSMKKSTKKTVCEMVHSIRRDDQGIFTVRYILGLIGISKTNYYSILRNDDYGRYEAEKEKRDQEDFMIIREVIDYRGYPKGSRMIHMMMEDVTGVRFSRNKIMRLMKKFGVNSGIREARVNRRTSNEFISAHRKPNLLKRRFRMARPLTHIVTDVAYLEYNDGDRAYMSAAKDAVTGRILAANISTNNDEALVMDTLDALSQLPLADDAIIHSDQGILYMMDAFQNRVSSMGMKQSMSRRGNCWDNASQESFFGHFRDDTDIALCNTIEEVRDVVGSYASYYNNERPQWSRRKMTPVKYESWLNGLDDIGFSEYLKDEQIRYDKMMADSAKKAHERAKDIGA